jgi:uncharacterized protein (TIGR02246 family)
VIARGHDEIFATMFKGTTLTATVEGIRFLRPDVATASVALALRQKDGMPWGPFPRTSAGLVAVRDGASWSIAVFRNMVPFQRPAAGPVERSLGAAPPSGS